jgi:hypothetical protein
VKRAALANGQDPAAYIVSVNLTRRNLLADERRRLLAVLTGPRCPGGEGGSGDLVS